jgi:hypothetical protein
MCRGRWIRRRGGHEAKLKMAGQIVGDDECEYDYERDETIFKMRLVIIALKP